METHYPGIYRGRDLYNDWLYYAARDAFPGDRARQEVLRMMFIIAVNPISIPKNWQAQLKRYGWRKSQISAIAPFAAFHAARIVVMWQASVPHATTAEAESEVLWMNVLPAEELW